MLVFCQRRAVVLWSVCVLSCVTPHWQQQNILYDRCARNGSVHHQFCCRWAAFFSSLPSPAHHIFTLVSSFDFVRLGNCRGEKYIFCCCFCTTVHMFRSTVLTLLRPRHIHFTAPPLARRNGTFRCKFCDNTWRSNHVWVTKTTQRVYQGESCEKCGTTNKPYFVGRPEETIFNRVRTPHPVKVGASTSRKERKLKHMRYDWRVQKGRH